ncbi:helicase associated domain-containing protein [Streptomyces sp. NPDC057696]|uniref:helicase associated domain-containing protein n=1 Tax=Streptomyces sp. NPDC057696 TaxID=3346218 RepID=UPI003698DC0B
MSTVLRDDLRFRVSPKREHGRSELRPAHTYLREDSAAARAAQLTAIDPDWDCPWPLDWQRHHRVLADLVDTEAGGVLPRIEPGVLFEGDDLGRWAHQQSRSWFELSEEQQQRLSALGLKPAERPTSAPPAKGTAMGPGKAQAAFQRGVAALAQYVAREGHHRVPRAHAEEVAVQGEAAPVAVKLGVWITNTKTRRDKLTPQQLAALAELGAEWA